MGDVEILWEMWKFYYSIFHTYFTDWYSEHILKFYKKYLWHSRQKSHEQRVVILVLDIIYQLMRTLDILGLSCMKKILQITHRVIKTWSNAYRRICRGVCTLVLYHTALYRYFVSCDHYLISFEKLGYWYMAFNITQLDMRNYDVDSNNC